VTGSHPSGMTITPAQNLPAIMALDYEHFVQCAFLTILNRPVDPDALEHYVERLKAGHPKLAILSVLYESDEARAANVRIPWMSKAIRRYKLTNIPVVRLAFMSDRRDVRLEFEHRLHSVEKKMALLTSQTAALVAELAELSTAIRHIAKPPEAGSQHLVAPDYLGDELSGESLVATRVYKALSDAIADIRGDDAGAPK
jgi:Domain of unknown function (DUF4214)